MALTNMKITVEKPELQAEAPKSEEEQEYPWGLRLHLGEKVLNKLDLGLHEIGKEFGIQAKAEVVEVSQRTDQEGQDKRLELQITDMDVVDPDAKQADRLFSSSAKTE